MPAEAGPDVGVKLVSLAPDNPSVGKQRIQAIYLLLDAQTLTPQALLDGVALTSLRTPAMSAVAVRRLAAPDARKLVVFGAGPQAEGHVAAVRAVRAVEDVVIVGRDPAKATALAERVEWSRRHHRRRHQRRHRCLRNDRIGGALQRRPGPLRTPASSLSARTSHTPANSTTRLMRRAHVVVEDRATALREAGDVLRADLATAGPHPDRRPG